jgi:hypothetical protein
VVRQPGALHGAEGDALVTATPGVTLAVFTADCAPVAFSSPEGVVAVAHAGWKGVEAGILEATAAAMRRLGATEIEAVLGPCIRPGCYDFGEHDLQRLVDLFGPSGRSQTASGNPALDLPGVVAVALARAEVALVGDHGGCTACSPEWFSYRARAESERQATVVVAVPGSVG